MMKTQRLSRLIGRKTVIKRPNEQDVIGYLGLNSTGQYYTSWDGGATIWFNDDDIDFVEINFIHLKPGSALGPGSPKPK